MDRVDEKKLLEAVTAKSGVPVDVSRDGARGPNLEIERLLGDPARYGASR